jgi:hypothetical protein
MVAAYFVKKDFLAKHDKTGQKNSSGQIIQNLMG